jgi:hypothetical protein
MEDRYISIKDLRKATQEAIQKREDEQKKLRQAHMMDLSRSMRDCVNEHMAVSAAKGHYEVSINMETALKTPCDTDEERQMRLKVLGDTATELHSRGFKVRYKNQLHISISWEE